MKTGFLIILSLIISINLFPQKRSGIDSLESLLEVVDRISERIEIYIELSKEYSTIDVDRSITIAEQALTLAKNIEDNESIGILNKLLGDLNLVKDQTSAAEMYFKLAIPYLEESQLIDDLIKTHLSIGNRYNETDNYPEAMNHYLKGIRYSEEEDIPDYLPSLFNNLGVVYLKLNNPEKALELYSQAIGLFRQNGDTMNVAGTTTNIGSIYLELEDYEVAKKYYLEGLALFDKISHPGGQAHALFKLGLLDIKIEKYQDALVYLQQSLEIQNKMDVSIVSRKMFQAETFVNIGIVYQLLGNNSKTEYYLNEGYKLARQTKQNSLIVLAAEKLSEYFRNKKQFETSLEFYEVFKQYSDSIYNEDNVKNITRLEMQYQYEGKLREAELSQLVAEQKRKRLNIIYLMVSIGLLLILTIAVLLLLLEKNKKRKVELEKKALSEKLDHTNKELTTYVMYLLRKNEFILSIIEKLKKTKLEAKPENKKVIAEMISELKSNTDTVSWDEFEVRFQEVHTDFYTNLHNKFPDLSTNEIRLCAFFKLNMTTKEIAAITYQSLNSIKVARYRLRKKLKLDQQDNLINFLAQF